MKLERNRIFKYIIVLLGLLLLIVTMLNYVHATSLSSFSGENKFSKIELREDNEKGTIIHDYVNDSNNGKVTSGKYYYLVTEVKDLNSIGSEDLYVKVSLGKKSGNNISINGLAYLSVPGSTFTPSDISSDSFDKLESYNNAPGVDYTGGSYDLKDGTLMYKVKPQKSNISMNISFSLDQNYWYNEDILQDAINIEIGTYEDGIFTSKSGFTGSIEVENNQKSVEISKNKIDTTCILGQNNAHYFSINGNSSSLLYKELVYEITYPNNAGIQLSTSGSTITNSATGVGKMEVLSSVNNSDDTVTKKIKLTSGYKTKNNHPFVYLHLLPQSPQYNVDDKIDVSISNAYITIRDSDEEISLLSSSEKAEMTMTMKNVEEIVDEEKLELTSIDRNPTAGYYGGYVYNWNIGRDENSYVSTSQLLGGALFKNTGTIVSKSQHINAYYNTTQENAIINFVTIPVGGDKDSDTGYLVTKNAVDVAWVGIDQDGNEKSGTTTCYTQGNGGSPFTILKSSDCGVVTIKHISVDVGQFNPGYDSRHANSTIDSNTCGAFGYFNDSSSGAKIYHTYEFIESDGTKRTTTTSVTSGSRLAAPFDNQVGLQGISSNNTHYSNSNRLINGGDSLTLKDQLLGNSSILANNRNPTCNTTINPVVYITLPKNISYSNLSFCKNSTKLGDYTKANPSSSNSKEELAFTIQNISYKNKTNDEVSIYKVIFKDRDLILGYYDQNGSVNYLSMDITLNVAKSTLSSNYYYRDFFHLSSESQTVCLGPGYGDNNMGQPESGTNISYNIEDKYDINGGNYLSLGSKGSKEAAMFSVQRMSALTVDSAIKVSKINGIKVPTDNQSWETYDPSNPNSIAFLGLKSEGQYKVNIENPSSSDAKNMMLIIPIPKKGEDLGNVFMDQSCQFSMSMNLDESSLPEGFSYKYVKLDNQYDNLSDVTYNIENSDSVTSSQANAFVLIGSQSAVLKGYEQINLLFDYSIDSTVDEPLTSGEMNIWRTALEYEFSDSDVVYGQTGSYVASEVAANELSGTVFLDINNNGILDGEEEGLSNITVTACDSNGRIQDTITDELGKYHFTQVREDEITITMIAPDKNGDSPTYGFFKEPLSMATGIVNEVKPNLGNKSAVVTINAEGDTKVVNGAASQIFVVDYDLNGRSGIAPAPNNYVMGSNFIVANVGSSINSDGFIFKGWKDSTSGNIYLPGESVTILNNTTLIAQWEEKEYKLSFNYQGGTSTQMPPYLSIKYTHWMSELRYSWPTNPSKDGWTFVKWEADLGQTLGTGNSLGWYPASGRNIYGYTRDITANAVFSKLTKETDHVSTYINTNITKDTPLYNLKEEVGVINDSSNDNATYKLKDGEVLPIGLTLTTDGEIIGTPTKVEDTSVTFVVTGNNGISFDFTLEINIKKTPVTAIVNTTPAYGIKLQTGGVNVSLSTTLEGIDEVDVNKIEYYIDDELKGSITDTDSILTPYQWNVDTEKSYKITIKVYPKNAENYDITYKNIDSYVVSATDLYEHELNFDLMMDTVSENAIKPNVGSMGVIEGQTYGELENPIIAGYSFKGWYLDKELANKVEKDNIVSIGNNNDSQTLYAKWIPNNYTVKFIDLTQDIDHQIIKEIDNQGYYNQVFYGIDDPIKEGYTFNGWSLKGDSKILAEDASYQSIVTDDESELEFVANYSANNYIINYDANGGSVKSQEKSVTYDQLYGTLDTAYRIGYTFDGWYDAIIGGNKIEADTRVDVASNQTLYAHWTVKNYTVEYDSQGGTSCSSKTVEYTANQLLPTTNPTKEGYIFKNFKYGNVVVTNDHTYGGLCGSAEINSIKLVAQWERILYSIEANQGKGYEIVPINNNNSLVYYGEDYEFKINIDNDYNGDYKTVTVNGVEISPSSEGIYKISNIKTSQTITVANVKRVIEKPSVENLIYNGEKRIPVIASNVDYEVIENNGGKDVGEYQVTLALKDVNTTIWQDDTTQSKNTEIKYQITQANNEFIKQISCINVSYGTSLVPEAESKYGNEHLYFMYAKEDGVYSKDKPSAVGTYYIKACVDGTNNYKELISEPIEVKIQKKAGDALPDEITIYGETIYGKNDGRVEGLDSSMEYSIDNGNTWIKITSNKLNNLKPGNYQVRKAQTSISEAGTIKHINITNGKKIIVTFEDGDQQFFGLSWHQTLNDITLPTISKKDGYVFAGGYSKPNGSGDKIINADNTLTQFANELKFESDMTIYANWTKLEYKVEKLIDETKCSVVAVDGSNETVNYGDDYKFKVNIKPGYSGGNMKVSVTNKETNEVSILNPNEDGEYHITNITANQQIKIEDIEYIGEPEGYIQISDLKWDNFNEVHGFDIYTTELKPILNIGNTTSRNVQYYVSNTPLSIDQLKGLEEDQWDTYTMPFPITTDGKYIVYMKYSNQLQDKYISSDGIILDSTNPVIKVNNQNIQDKTYYGKVQINVNDDNLQEFTINGIIQDLNSNQYTLTPRKEPYTLVAKDKAGNKTETTILVDYQYISIPLIDNLIYNGDNQIPHLDIKDIYSIDYLEVGTHVGKYYGQLTLKDPTIYKWTDEESQTIIIDYQIIKGTNEWLQALTCKDITEGEKLNPQAIGKYGNAVYLYADNKDGNYSTIIPDQPGTYYIKAIIEGTEDYDSITSEVVSFKIIKDKNTSQGNNHQENNSNQISSINTGDDTSLLLYLTLICLSFLSIYKIKKYELD